MMTSRSSKAQPAQRASQQVRRCLQAAEEARNVAEAARRSLHPARLEASVPKAPWLDPARFEPQ